MLQVIRDKVQGLIVWFIVGAIILSFALWGINDYLRKGDTGLFAATVNKQDVPVSEYKLAYQNELNRMRQMLGENFDEEMFSEQLKNSAIERVIGDTLLTQSAENLGFRISQTMLAQKIQELDVFKENGAFSKSLYEKQLNAAGQSTSSFENRMARAALTDQVIRGVAASGFASDYDAQQFGLLTHQEREVGYLTIPVAKFKKDLTIADDQVQSYYKENEARFKTEEMVSVDYLEVTQTQLASQIEVTDDELAEFYDEQKDRYSSAEERHARHILISVDSKKPAEEAKKKAQDIFDRIKKGESFEALAKQFSDDPGSASKGGDLGFFAKGIMDKAFEETTFALQKGEVSEPVRSQFGYHIIKLEDTKSGGTKAFDKVKPELLQELKRQKAEKIYVDRIEKLTNATYEMPESLDVPAEELGLDIKNTGFFTRRGGAGVAANQKVISAAFSNEVLNDRHNSAAIEISPTQTIVIHKKDYKGAETKPLNEVRTQIENELKEKLAKEKVEQAGKDLVAKIKDGQLADTLSKNTGFAWTKPQWVDRTQSKIDAEITRFAFKLSKPGAGKVSVGGQALAGGDFAVTVVSGVRQGKIDPGAQTGDRTNLANAFGFDEFGLYLEALKASAEIKKFPGNL